MLFRRMTYNIGGIPVPDMGAIYKENDVDSLAIVEMSIVSDTQGSMIYKNLNRGKIMIMIFEFNTGTNSIDITLKILQKPMMNLNDFKAAKFTS